LIAGGIEKLVYRFMRSSMRTELSLEARVILGLLATGLSTAEVAVHLGMSPAEIRSQLAEAIEALGASSKLEAVILAIEQGLIDRPQLSKPTCPDRANRP
jgi:DNA-binding CsgD family transcriptional regulator